MSLERLIVPTRNNGIFLFDPDFNLERIVNNGVHGCYQSFQFNYNGRNAIGILDDSLSFHVYNSVEGEKIIDLGQRDKVNPVRTVVKSHIDDERNLRLFFIDKSTSTLGTWSSQNCSIDYFKIDESILGIDKIFKYSTNYYLTLIKEKKEKESFLSPHRYLFEYNGQLAKLAEFKGSPEFCSTQNNAFCISFEDNKLRIYDLRKNQENTLTYNKEHDFYTVFPLGIGNLLFALIQGGVLCPKEISIYDDQLNLIKENILQDYRKMNWLEREFVFSDYFAFVDSFEDRKHIQIFDKKARRVGTISNIDAEYDVMGGDEINKQFVEQIEKIKTSNGDIYFVRMCTQQYHIYNSNFGKIHSFEHYPDFYEETGAVNKRLFNSSLHHLNLASNDYFVITSNSHICEIRGPNFQIVESFDGAGPDVLKVSGPQDFLAISLRSDDIRVYDTQINLIKTLNAISNMKLDKDSREILAFYKEALK